MWTLVYRKKELQFAERKTFARSVNLISGEAKANLYGGWEKVCGPKADLKRQVGICFLASGGRELLVPAQERWVLNIQEFCEQINQQLVVGNLPVRVFTPWIGEHYKPAPPQPFFFPKSQSITIPLPSFMCAEFTIHIDAIFQRRSNREFSQQLPFSTH